MGHETLIEEDKLCDSVEEKQTVKGIHSLVTNAPITNHPTGYSGKTARVCWMSLAFQQC